MGLTVQTAEIDASGDDSDLLYLFLERRCTTAMFATWSDLNHAR